MPHNIYLHSALVQSRTIDRSNKKAVGEACKYNSIDSTISLVLSFFINLAVVAVFAKGFFNKEDCARPGWDIYTYPYKSQNPHTTGKQSNQNLGCLAVNVSDVARVTANASASVPTLDGCHRFSAGQPSVAANAFMPCQTPGGGAGLCCEIGLSNAAVALRGVLGEAAPIVWGVGLLAAGQASTMTGTFAGQFVMEGFMKWKVRKGPGFILTLHYIQCAATYLTTYIYPVL
jgi:natural resistance-associated macrophage protein